MRRRARGIRGARDQGRAFVLPVVLLLIGLLALTMAGFLFFARAEAAGIQAQRDSQQARLAAQSGLEEVVTVLRAEPNNPDAWYDVPERFRHALVWSEAYRREDDPVAKMGSRVELLRADRVAEAWRYSVVAMNLDGPPDTIRYGVTPEAGKLNINAATDTEIEALLLPLLTGLGIETAPELVAALLDWRDEDDEPRPGGAENEYYNNLEPGYNTKNGRFDTIEELLLVKGFSAAVLYGEDVNRNGLLDANEDDGDRTAPYYDNGSGELDHGLAPFITVWSREPRLETQPQGSGGPQDGQRPEGEDDPDADAEDSGSKDSRRQDRGGGAPPTGPGGPPPGGQGPSGQPQGRLVMKEGLVNVNTAPLIVLRALDDMPPEAAEAIVTLRQELAGETLAQPDWPVTMGAMDAGTFEALQDKLTTRALQFHVEILGYGDHTQLVRRYEWVIEMRGQLVQVLYHRDLTALGVAWPVDDDSYLVIGG